MKSVQHSSKRAVAKVHVMAELVYSIATDANFMTIFGRNKNWIFGHCFQIEMNDLELLR
jgi:hypothetical protein